MQSLIPSVKDVVDCATFLAARSRLKATPDNARELSRVVIPMPHSGVQYSGNATSSTGDAAICVNSLDTMADVVPFLRWLRDTSSEVFTQKSPVIALLTRSSEAVERLHSALRQAAALLSSPSPNELPIPGALGSPLARETLARGAISWLPADRMLYNCVALQEAFAPDGLGGAVDPVTLGDVVAFCYDLLVPHCSPEEVRLQPSTELFASATAEAPVIVPTSAHIAAAAGFYLVIDVATAPKAKTRLFGLLPLSSDAVWDPALDRATIANGVTKAHGQTSRILHTAVLNALGLSISLCRASEVYRVGRLCHPQRLGEPAAADGGAAAMAAWAGLLAEEAASAAADGACSRACSELPPEAEPLLGGLAYDLSMALRLHDVVRDIDFDSSNDESSDPDEGQRDQVEEGCLRCFGGGDAGRIIAPFDFLHIVQHRDACTTCGHPHSVARGVAVPIAPTDWKAALSSSRYASWRYCASEFTPAQFTLDVLALPKKSLYVRQVPRHHVAYPGYQVVTKERIVKGADKFTIPYPGRCLEDDSVDILESTFEPCEHCSAVKVENLPTSTIYQQFSNPELTEELDRKIASMYVFGTPWVSHIVAPCVYGGMVYTTQELRKYVDQLGFFDYRVDASAVGWVSSIMNDPKGYSQNYFRDTSQITKSASLAVNSVAITVPGNTYIELQSNKTCRPSQEITFDYCWPRKTWRSNINLYRRLIVEQYDACKAAGERFAFSAPIRCFTTTILQTLDLPRRSALRSTECMISAAQMVQVCGSSPPRLTARCLIVSGEDILKVGGDVIPSLPDSLPPACVCPWEGKVPYDKSTLSCEHVGVLPCPCPKFVAVLCQPDDASCAWVLRPNGSPFARAICVAGVDACSCGKCSVRTTAAHPAFYAPNGVASTLKWPTAGYNAIIQLRHEPKTGLAYCMAVAVSDIQPSEVIVVRAPKIDAVYRSEAFRYSDLPSLGFCRVPIPIALDAERMPNRRIYVDQVFSRAVTAAAMPFTNTCKCPMPEFLKGLCPIKYRTVNGTLVGPRCDYPAVTRPQCPPMWVYGRAGRKVPSFVVQYSNLYRTTERPVACSIPASRRVRVRVQANPSASVSDEGSASLPLVKLEPSDCAAAASQCEPSDCAAAASQCEPSDCAAAASQCCGVEPVGDYYSDRYVQLVVVSMDSFPLGGDASLNASALYDGAVLVCDQSELFGERKYTEDTYKVVDRYLKHERPLRAAVVLTHHQAVPDGASKTLSAWCTSTRLRLLPDLATASIHDAINSHFVHFLGFFVVKTDVEHISHHAAVLKRRAFNRCLECPPDCEEYDPATAIYEKCYPHTTVFVGLSVGGPDAGGTSNGEWFLAPVTTAQLLLGDRFIPCLLSFYEDLRDFKRLCNATSGMPDLKQEYHHISSRAAVLLAEANTRFVEIIDIDGSESDSESVPAAAPAPAPRKRRRERTSAAWRSSEPPRTRRFLSRPPLPPLVFKRLHKFVHLAEVA